MIFNKSVIIRTALGVFYEQDQNMRGWKGGGSKDSWFGMVW
jgi:hypothetical protein